jgi:putative peptidoglycan lipid II flippase
MVKSLLSLLSTRQNNILSAASILMVTIFASKFLGLIRNRLLVHNFDSATAAQFLGAFSLPDLLFQLLIFGALSVAFIPIFTDYLHHKGEKEAFSFASSILNLSLIIFLFFVILAYFFTPSLNSLLLPGFGGQQKAVTDELTRIILFGQVLLVIGAFFIGIGQSFQRFIIPSLAPIFYNVGIILGIIILTPYFGIMGPAYGVVLGALMHFLVQYPLVRSLGFKFSLSLDISNSGVREIFKLMSVRNIGLVFEQVSDRVAVALSSIISYSSVTLLTFAQQLFIVPITLFGVTIAQAALPVLAQEYSKKELPAFKSTLLTTMHQILFLTLPSAAILIVLRIPIVRLIYGANQFSWDDTVLTGRTVAFFALGLSAQAVIHLLVRAFYTMKDTHTPVIVSIITVLVNIILSLVFVQNLNWDVWSLGLSYAITTNASFFMLLFYLRRKVGGFDSRDLLVPASKMLLASAVAAAALYIPMKLLDQLVFDTTRTINLILLTGIASVIGLGIYLLLVWFMNVKEVYTFAELLKKIFSKRFSSLKSEEITEDKTGV